MFFFFYRVQTCISSGNVYQLRDPDPNQAYTRTKKATCKCSLCSASGSDDDTSTSTTGKVNSQIAPKDGWKNDIPHQLYKFTYKNIMDWASNSGRRPGATNYVEKTLQKGYKFFFENFVHDACAVMQGNHIFIKARCFKSQKKNDAPHRVSAQIDCETLDVVNAHCSCKAGTTGFCNHVIGLLLSRPFC